MHGGNTSLLYLNRPRIDQMLENIFHNSITLITAPIGFGKSTSLQHFLSQKKDVFYRSFTFREQENDDVWFWKRFNEILINSKPDLQPFLEQVVFPQSESEILHYLSIVRGLVKTESVCIVDDYHECDSPVLNRVLEAMAYARIPLLHLVVIGRAFPSVPYEELALKASCLIIDQQDLLFTRDETAALAELNHITLTGQQLNWCLEYSGGWSSAICLVLNEYRQTGHMTHSMSTRELIRSSILDKLDEQEKDILEPLSVIKSFLPEQAAFLTSEPAAADIILRIASRHGFITERKDHVIEINTLLQETAVASYLRNGHNREDVFFKNGQWYESQNDLIPAVRNYALAGRYDRVIRLIDCQACLQMISSSPVLFADIMHNMPVKERNSLHHMFEVPELLSVFHDTPGSYSETLHFVSSTISRIAAPAQGVHLGWQELLSAEYSYETGDIRKAADLARSAYALSSWKKENGISISASLIIAKCLLYNGQIHQLSHIIPGPDSFEKDTDSPFLILDAELSRFYLNGLANGVSDLPDWLIHMDIPETSQVGLESGAIWKAQGMFCLQTHQYDMLNILAERMLEESTIGHFVFRVIHGYIFKALYLWRQADQSEAVHQLQHAIDLAAPDHLCMTLAEYGDRLLPLLQLVRKNPFSTELIERCTQYGRGLSSMTPSENTITLTDREKEILELVSDGKTNVQISEALHLARITIEKNLTTIYRKMDVSNRAAAIMKYQDMIR